MKYFVLLAAFLDVLLVTFFDPDRELVSAAKHWVRLRRERCPSCECCDAQIAVAWENCQGWRRLQRVKRSSLGSLTFTMAAVGKCLEST